MTKQIFSFFILLQERAKPIRPRAFFRLSLRARSKLPTVAGESERRRSSSILIPVSVVIIIPMLFRMCWHAHSFSHNLLFTQLDLSTFYERK